MGRIGGNERNSHENGPKTKQRQKSLGHKIDYVGKKKNKKESW